MTRYTFMREGEDWAINGNWFLPGALKWDQDGKYPILGPTQDQLLGGASDLRREDDGSITADFLFGEGVEDRLPVLLDLPEPWGWTIYAKNVASEGRKVESAKLVYIFMGHDIPWSGASQKKQGS